MRQLFIPQGRAGRSELLVVAGVLLAVQLAVAALDFGMAQVPQALGLLANGLIGWIGLVATARRLHDMGYSAWWILAGMGALCIWSVGVAVLAVMIFGMEAIRPEQSTYAVLLGLLVLPLLGGTLWLHLSAGDPLPNRHGLPMAGSPDARPAAAEGAASDLKLS